MIEIDGSQGEGGGQILRTSVALSAVTNTPVRITRIRHNRPKPGLAAQHVTAISALAELCSAKTTGVSKGSTEISFEPGEITGGHFAFDIGTAGSITLVLQALLPVVLKAGTKTTLELTGGTDVRFAPPVDYFRYVLKPFLEKMGAVIEITEIARGYYPKGGGRVTLTASPNRNGLDRLDLGFRGDLNGVSGHIHYANLPDHIPKRMKKALETEQHRFGASEELALNIDRVENSRSPGVGISLTANYENSVLGSNALGERGIPAESLVKNAVEDLLSEIRTGAVVDAYAADQLLPYMAGTKSTIIAKNPLTDHTLTNLAVIRQITGSEFTLSEQGETIRIDSQ
jgi:RNA 3'-terminal phosphate cyclase (ATP)/RNA 3'-terminal phosphate cyclase (GTP)